MKPVILMIEPIDLAEPELEEHYEVHRLFSAVEPNALLDEIGPRVRGVVTGGGTGVSNAILDRLAGLEIIAVNGVGLDAVDLQRCRTRNIRVTTTPGVLNADVAEMAIGLMFAVVRGLCTADRFVRAGNWEAGKPRALGGRLQGRRVGVFGLGGIGRAIAERAFSLGMPVAYTGRRPREDVPFAFVVDLATLARQSDILVVAASAGPQTRGVIDARVLEDLGPEGVLINVSRGSLLDEAALVEAISSGRLGGAGLDVFIDEPHVPEALKHSDRVVLQPHNGSATHEARQAMARLVLDNLASHFRGSEPPTAVC